MQQHSQAIDPVLLNEPITDIPQITEALSLTPSTEPTVNILEEASQVDQHIAKFTSLIDQCLVRLTTYASLIIY